MTEVTAPRPLTVDYGHVLASAKHEFVVATDDQTWIAQHGATTIDAVGFPGWPSGLTSAEPVIETFVAGAANVQATSDNDHFVSAWSPLVEWMSTTVRAALDHVGVELTGDAYITVSLTDAAQLGGTAHMDDDVFVAADSVGVVAIIGEHIGPRVATGALEHPALRPMSQVTFDDGLLQDFEADRITHCAGAADQLVVFPQFGQLHAGPAAHHLGDESTRQLAVFRARAVTRG